MKRFFLFAAIFFVAAASAVRAQDDGFRPIVNPPRGKTLIETLQASGNYKTLVSIVGKVGLDALGLGKNSKEQITLFAPNDAAFARLPKAQLDALMKDAAKLKTLLLAHAVKGKVAVADLLVPVAGGGTKTYKELKSLHGRVMGFSCNGHTGEHHPRIKNGKGMIGKGDIAFDKGFVHEIDEVMATDFLFAGPGGGPR